MSTGRYCGRFAPSPTGPLHLGSLVAALASWLDARAHRGRWLVRIEDIDPPREEPGAARAQLAALTALGLAPDQPPVFQSACSDRYREALEALPGVGRKTANVVLNVAFGEPTIAVDTHIFRVANRTGLAPGKDVGEVEQRLMKMVPEEFRQHAHHWLILHGRYVCTARRPKCWQCGIAKLCEFSPKTAAPA